MDCQQIQPLLALAVGQDLPDGDCERTVTLHLQQCPNCREHRQALAMARSVLQDAQPTVRLGGGLWPRISAQLAECQNRRPLARFNVWVPTVVAAMACGILVAIAALEISKKVNPQTTVFIRSMQAPTRNLFDTDPTFSKSHGRLISEQDVAAWRQSQGELVQPARYQPDLRYQYQPDF